MITKENYDKIVKIISKRHIMCFKQTLNSDASIDYETQRATLSLDRSYDLETLEKTICIIEFSNGIESACCLGWIIKKGSLSTYKAKLFIKNFGVLSFDSFASVSKKIVSEKLKNKFLTCINEDISLSSDLCGIILELIKNDDENILSYVLDALSPKQKNNVQLLREDAIDFALKAFGIPINKKDLYETGVRLHEDNVITKDANEIDGYINIQHTNIGKTIFVKNENEYLTVYSANKQSLEEMLGVDLIYINETCGNIVMVQYKMLERENDDWIFRNDKQVAKEIDRMVLLKYQTTKTDYRLNANPFYFRFVKRSPGLDADGIKTFNITLEHYNLLVVSPESRGKRGGIRISYKDLNGTYLRETEFIDLIHSGYIGTHTVDTELLKPIINLVAEGHKEIVLAWQHKICKPKTKKTN